MPFTDNDVARIRRFFGYQVSTINNTNIQRRLDTVALEGGEPEIRLAQQQLSRLEVLADHSRDTSMGDRSSKNTEMSQLIQQLSHQLSIPIQTDISTSHSYINRG
jgi:hypothetical protein